MIRQIGLWHLQRGQRGLWQLSAENDRMHAFCGSTGEKTAINLGFVEKYCTNPA
jgi:hypothetical protein